MKPKTLSRALLFACLALGASSASAFAQSAYSTEMAAGREAFDGSNFMLAERHFDGAARAAGSDGQKSTALYSLAVALQRQGRIEEAKTNVGEAIKLSPKNSQAQRLLEELNATAAKPEPKGQKTAKAAAAATSDGGDPGSMERAVRKSGNRAEADALKAQAKETASREAKDGATKDGAAQREKAARATKEPTEAREHPKEIAQAGSRETTGSIPAPKPKEVAAGKAVAPAATSHEAPAKAETPKSERRKSETARAEEPKLDTSHLGTPEPSGARLLLSVAPDASPVLAAGFSRLDHQVAIVTGPGREASDTPQSIELKRFDLATGKAGDTFALHTDVKAGLVALPPSGGLILSAVPGPQKGKSPLALIHLWDAQTVENTQAIEMDVERGSSAAGVDRLVFSRNGKRAAVLHKTGVQMFETGSLRGTGSYRVSAKGDHPPAIALSATGSRAVLTNGTRLRLIDGSSIKDVGPASNKDSYEHVALTDGGTLIAVSSGAHVRFIDAGSGKEQDALPDAASDVTALAFSPGGDRIAVGRADKVSVYTVSGRKLAVELAIPGRVDQLSFSNDGQLIVAAGSKGARVWSIDPALLANAEKAPEAKPADATAAVPAPATATEPEKTADAAKPVGPAVAEKPAEPARAADAAATPPATEPKASVEKPAAETPKRSQAAMAAERRRAIANADCDRVKELDLEIGDAGQYATCTARAEAARRKAENERNLADRRAAFDAGDCDRVKSLDAAIGTDAQHAACIAKAAAAKAASERTARVAERQVAFDKLDCEAVKALDAKIPDSTPMSAGCMFQATLKTGSARELYLAAAKADADKDRAGAKQLYRAIVDRFPNDDLALKAADRMTFLGDQEAGEPPTTTGSLREKGKAGRGTRR